VSEKQLCQCHSGSSGIVTKVEGDSHTIARLQELGVLAGQWIHIVRAGNPLIFEIGDSRYCIRPKQLHGVTIQLISNKPGSTIPSNVLSTVPERYTAMQSDT